MTTTEITLGEVYRLLETQGKTLATMATSMEARPTWDDIGRMEEARVERGRLHQAKETIQDQAIKALEEKNTWQVRTLAGTLLTALVGLGTAAVNAARLGGL